MKKALTTIVCVLAMLCFGFVAVGMQITTATVYTAGTELVHERTYDEETGKDVCTVCGDAVEHEHNYETETGFCICGDDNGACDVVDEPVVEYNVMAGLELCEEAVKLTDAISYQFNSGLTLTQVAEYEYELSGDFTVCDELVLNYLNFESGTEVVFAVRFVILDAREGQVFTITGNQTKEVAYDAEETILILDAMTLADEGTYVIAYTGTDGEADVERTLSIKYNAGIMLLDEEEADVNSTDTDSDNTSVGEQEPTEAPEEPVEEPAEEPEVICEHVHGYDNEGKCHLCGAKDTDDANWMPFNRYILKLVHLEDKEAMADGAFWYTFTEIAAIVLFAIAAFMFGLTLTHKFVKGDRAPKAPKQKKTKVKKVKESAAKPEQPARQPRVKW